MSSEETKLKNLKKQFQNSPDIHESNKEWLAEYIKYNDRVGAKSPGTKANYVQAVKDILEHHEVQVRQLDDFDNKELKQFNLDVVDAISDSRYKDNGGDFSKRRKTHFWTAWKRCLETQGISTDKNEEYIPKTSFSSSISSSDQQAQTHPDDLPTSTQVKEYLQTLGQVSHRKTALRNQALVLFIWDTGARIGEALNVQMKHLSVKKDRVHVKIHGNKGAEDRRVELFQGRKALIELLEQHPERSNPDAYLFPQSYRNDWTQKLETSHLRHKINQAQKVSGLDFKTKGEPFHIFRKGMTTYYKINDILDWEEICERQGKSPDGTMPTYLKMAMEDIDSKAAEGFGLDTETREMDHRMRGPPLLPQECTSCGTESKCFKENCESCGHELEGNTMPDNLSGTTEQEIVEDVADIQAKILEVQMENPDASLNDVKQQILKEENQK